jgi:hypothetical protein
MSFRFFGSNSQTWFKPCVNTMGETRRSTAERRCVVKRQKRISLRCLLHVRSENLMVFTGFRVAEEVFRAKIRSPTCSLDAERKS